MCNKEIFRSSFIEQSCKECRRKIPSKRVSSVIINKVRKELEGVRLGVKRQRMLEDYFDTKYE